MTLHVTGPVWAWLLLALIGVVIGPIFSGIGHDAADRRSRRRLREIKYEQKALARTRRELEQLEVAARRTFDQRMKAPDGRLVQALSRIIEDHREQVELIENGVTPKGFTSTDSGEQFNEADRLLYARYQHLVTFPGSLLEPDPAGGVQVKEPPSTQPRVIPVSPPAPPIPPQPSQEA